MKTRTLELAALLAPVMLLAGPADKVALVADGYPDWHVASAKGHIAGREICPSDLRHRATVVIEVEANEKLYDQLLQAANLAGMGAQALAASNEQNWETRELARDVISVVICHGVKSPAAVLEAMKPKKGDKASQQLMAYYNSLIPGLGCPVYEGLTFTGAPDSTGKRPYVYVMGPTGKEPLFQGELKAGVGKDVKAAVEKAKKEMSDWPNKWVPFYGNIPEPMYHPQLRKALEKGRAGKPSPLDPVAKSMLADVKSQDAAKAKEAQVLFDAINQTRDDLVVRILMEAQTCPHRAYYDIQELTKFWPSEKKTVEAAAARVKANPDFEALAKMFSRAMDMSRPDFPCKNATEAKKFVQELNKMKKSIAKLKDAKNITVQNGALLLEMKVDGLIAQFQMK